MKVVLKFSNYANKKELDHATGIEIDKLDFTKLIKVQASLNILKTNPDDLDVGKLKTVSVYLKKMNWFSKSTH